MKSQEFTNGLTGSVTCQVKLSYNCVMAVSVRVLQGSIREAEVRQCNQAAWQVTVPSETM